jgi:hypothetical protein
MESPNDNLIYIHNKSETLSYYNYLKRELEFV